MIEQKNMKSFCEAPAYDLFSYHGVCHQHSLWL